MTESQTPSPSVHHTHRRRQNLLGIALAVGGALSAFGCVSLIIAAILLPPIYRAQPPYVQEQWCVRVRDNLGSEIVCDWKPTPPFEVIPTLSGPTQDPDFDPLSLLTPATLPPDETTPAATESGLQTTPFNVNTSGMLPEAMPTLSPTASPTFTPTPPPTLAPTALPSPTPTATTTPIPRPASYRLDLSRITPHPQWWNNCGPATLTMALSYYGYNASQGPAANFLKPNSEDKNVSPFQMVQYANQQTRTSQEVYAEYRVGGDLDAVRTLLAYDFPVIIEMGFEFDDLGWMGHYLLLVGYDDAQQIFYTFDSFRGHGNSQGLQEPYAEIAANWRHFNHTFIVLYDAPRRAQLVRLLGELAEPRRAAEIALQMAQTDASENPNDRWAWFNMGHSFTNLRDYERAAQAFDQAFQLGMPYRTLWYQHSPYVAYFAVGRYDDVLNHASATAQTTPYVEETFFFRGAALAQQGDTNGARAAFNSALSYNANFVYARLAREALDNGSFNADLVLNTGMGGAY